MRVASRSSRSRWIGSTATSTITTIWTGSREKQLQSVKFDSSPTKCYSELPSSMVSSTLVIVPLIISSIIVSIVIHSASIDSSAPRTWKSTTITTTRTHFWKIVWIRHRSWRIHCRKEWCWIRIHAWRVEMGKIVGNNANLVNSSNTYLTTAQFLDCTLDTRPFLVPKRNDYHLKDFSHLAWFLCFSLKKL